MNKRDFGDALRQLDEALARDGMSAQADARIRRRLRARADSGLRRLTRLWAAGAMLGVATAALVLVVRLRGAPALAAGFAVSGASSDLKIESDGEVVRIVAGGCTLADPALAGTFAAHAPAVLRRELGGVGVLAGTVEVHVDKRATGAPPAVVRVSGGAIGVMGTRFTVEQAAGAGHVTLHEGAIRFTALDGREVTLRPTEVLAWPLPPPTSTAPTAPTAPAVTPPERPPATAAASAAAPARRRPVGATRGDAERVTIEALLRHIAALRIQGRYEECARLLSDALAGDLPEATRERLSFELGTLLAHQLHDSTRACAHWLEHQRLYQTGRYEQDIRQSIEELGCPLTKE
jgi:transmembrane sensor